MDAKNGRAGTDRGISRGVSRSRPSFAALFPAAFFLLTSVLPALPQEPPSGPRVEALASDDPARLEVDRLVAEARRSYELGNLDAALASLAKAEALWRVSYPDLTYPALAFWSGLLRIARDTGNARSISRNDPLYSEMTQYLSLARMKYDEGVAFRKAGKQVDAKRSFDACTALLASVTRTFPLNADAGYLSLLVLKATNEAEFRATLANRIDEAAASLQRDPVAGYARIADLARIEPGNARLQRLLAQAEIATGKRRPEPSVSEKARSRQLSDEARQLTKTGRKPDLALAGQRLAEALALDPDNRDAQALSLNVQVLLGGGPERQLGADDLQRLGDAQRLYSQGQYNRARDGLDPLLADESTRTREVLVLDARLNELGY